MSAWIVEKEHIDVLVAAAVRFPSHGAMVWKGGGIERTATREEKNRLGQMLWDQNHRSVNDRYGEDMPGRVYEYTEPPAGRMPSPVSVLKQIACYEYQSCETADWKRTSAYSFCLVLRLMTIDRLDGYAEAPWGIGPGAWHPRYAAGGVS